VSLCTLGNIINAILRFILFVIIEENKEKKYSIKSLPERERERKKEKELKINSKVRRRIMKNNAHKRRSRRIHDAIQTDADVSICEKQIPGVSAVWLASSLKFNP
jgi:DNA-directed RNA polymerase subunit E'/Rpb7